jgi:hypothetical protein
LAACWGGVMTMQWESITSRPIASATPIARRCAASFNSAYGSISMKRLSSVRTRGTNVPLPN